MRADGHEALIWARPRLADSPHACVLCFHVWAWVRPQDGGLSSRSSVGAGERKERSDTAGGGTARRPRTNAASASAIGSYSMWKVSRSARFRSYCTLCPPGLQSGSAQLIIQKERKQKTECFSLFTASRKNTDSFLLKHRGTFHMFGRRQIRHAKCSLQFRWRVHLKHTFYFLW